MSFVEVIRSVPLSRHLDTTSADLVTNTSIEFTKSRYFGEILWVPPQAYPKTRALFVLVVVLDSLRLLSSSIGDVTTGRISHAAVAHCLGCSQTRKRITGRNHGIRQVWVQFSAWVKHMRAENTRFGSFELSPSTAAPLHATSAAHLTGDVRPPPLSPQSPFGSLEIIHDSPSVDCYEFEPPHALASASSGDNDADDADSADVSSHQRRARDVQSTMDVDVTTAPQRQRITVPRPSTSLPLFSVAAAADSALENLPAFTHHNLHPNIDAAMHQQQPLSIEPPALTAAMSPLEGKPAPFGTHQHAHRQANRVAYWTRKANHEFDQFVGDFIIIDGDKTLRAHTQCDLWKQLFGVEASPNFYATRIGHEQAFEAPKAVHCVTAAFGIDKRPVLANVPVTAWQKGSNTLSFLVDTGATMTSVSAALCRGLGYGAFESDAPAVAMTGATGVEVYCFVRLLLVRIDQFVFHIMALQLDDYSLLGMDILEHCRVVIERNGATIETPFPHYPPTA